MYKEQKIDVPESWIRGFLQVQSAMSLPTVSLRVQPIDIYNLCTFLRRNREKQGPRSLRYRLRPGQPVQVVIDPWGEVLTFSQTVYTGDVDREIRTWGRRRLFLLEKLLPSPAVSRFISSARGCPVSTSPIWVGSALHWDSPAGREMIGLPREILI